MRLSDFKLGEEVEIFKRQNRNRTGSYVKQKDIGYKKETAIVVAVQKYSITLDVGKYRKTINLSELQTKEYFIRRAQEMPKLNISDERLIELCKEHGTGRLACTKIAEIEGFTEKQAANLIGHRGIKAKLTEIERTENFNAYYEKTHPEKTEAPKINAVIEKMPKYALHENICNKLNETYRIKNTAYGDSFGKRFKKRGLLSALIRIEDKFERFDALVNGADPNGETIKDTLLDLANYAIMTLIELEENP